MGMNQRTRIKRGSLCVAGGGTREGSSGEDTAGVQGGDGPANAEARERGHRQPRNGEHHSNHAISPATTLSP